MQVLKKYAQLIDFIKVFNKYNDANTLVNISDDDYNIFRCIFICSCCCNESM